MTGIVVPFVSVEERSARQNLDAFIQHAKQAKFLSGPRAVEWSSPSWDLRPFAKTRSQNPVGWVFHFTTYESTVRGPRSADAVDLPEPFMDAAKASIASFLNATGMANANKLLTVLRIVEKALRDLGLESDLHLLDNAVLDRAAAIIQADYTDMWSYGRSLERFALDTVEEARLSVKHIAWRSPFEYQGAKRSDRVNREGGPGEHTDKLPHLKCVLDLASVFNSPQSAADVVVTAWFALAMFSPTRVNEILTLPVDCETEMEGVYGLSWRPLKGGAPMTKFAVTDEWADVAREAVRRLREVGAPARAAAAWYTANPGYLYLPESMEHLRGQPLTKWEVAHVLGIPGGFSAGSSLDSSLKRTGLKTSDAMRTGGKGSSKLFDFASVEQYIVKTLPREFPLADKRHGLLAQDALFCLPRHVLHTEGGVQSCVPDFISDNQIRHDLGSKPQGNTLFHRHGLLDPATGQPWKLNTHQPRHLLNTLAQSKYLAQALIAFWSGRKRVEQNAWYNHVPQEAFIEAFVRMGESAPRELRVVGPLEDKVAERSRREMVSLDDALRLEVGSVIKTRYGLCRHDYSLTPCPRDKNCIGCGENAFVKGDVAQLTEARKQWEVSARAAENCRRAMADGEPGVERWLAKHEEAEARWALAVDLLTDPSIPDGTLVTLPPPSSSQTRTGLAIAVRKVNPVVGASGAGSGILDDLTVADDI